MRISSRRRWSGRRSASRWRNCAPSATPQPFGSGPSSSPRRRLPPSAPCCLRPPSLHGSSDRQERRPSMARIGLVAHDDKKDEMVAWAAANFDKLSRQDLWGTGTTGGRVMAATGLPVTLLKSGPLGGDQQLGALIAEG